MSEMLLLEVGTEEIPHEILTKTIEQFKSLTIKKMTDAGVVFGKLFVYGTPRRLAIQMIDLETKTKEKTVEKKGPVYKAAFDSDGNPTRALIGFLKSNGADLNDIEKREVKGNPYVFLSKKEGGEDLITILPEIFKDIIFSIGFPKTMRWGNSKISFVRPIRWIVSLLGKEIIPFEIENISSGKLSVGHRLLGNKPFAIENPLDYKNLLKEKEVIVDQDERKNLIRDKIEKTAARLKAKPVLDDKLLDTLVNLTEFPDVAVGKFESEFLELPKEVLISEMIDHQKYVPLVDAGGNLINNFIIVTNTVPSNDIIKGNERVIRARFSDGKFFFDEDRKKTLEDFLPGLKTVAFAKGLGTLSDKVARMEKLVGIISRAIGYQDVSDNAIRTARLAKADLVTNMVNEFDELQGVMGYYYALQSNENINVAISIKEHYYPRFSGDDLPSLKEGILVSLAERLDNLFALYAVGKYVTGSKDPFALRRQTLGIIRILIEKEIHLDFAKLFDEILPLYEGFLSVEKSEFNSQILNFITTRIKTVFKEYGFAYDEIDAGIMSDVSDIYDSYLRIKSIHESRQTEEFANLAVAFKRVKNILKGQEADTINESVLSDEAEKALYKVYSESEKSFLEAIEKRDYALSVSILKSFRGPVDRFFDEVMVMADDEKLKNNRIALLAMIDKMFILLIDFAKIVVE